MLSWLSSLFAGQTLAPAESDPMTPPLRAPVRVKRTSLLSLPPEILADILLHVDKSTAIALTGVHPQLASLDIDYHLWTHLRLTVPDHAPESRWSLDTMEQEEELGLKVRAVVEQGDARRVGMVRPVEMIPQPSAMDDILTILALAAPTLETLIIGAPLPHYSGDCWRPESNDALDVRLFNSGTVFPALRTLILGHRATHFPGLTSYLHSLCPTLHTLTLDITPQPWQPFADPAFGPVYPPPQPHLHVRNLRISRQNDGANFMSIIETFEAHLRRFPNVRRLSLDYPLAICEDFDRDWPEAHPEAFGLREASKRSNEEDRDETMSRLVPALGRFEQVEDLEWRTVKAGEFCRKLLGRDAAFQTLRRLVLGPVAWSYLSNHVLWEAPPNLESIFFTGLDPQLDTSWDHTVQNPPSSNLPGRLGSFAWALYTSPKLRLMHVLDPETLTPGLGIFDQLDEIASSDTPNGRISSYRYGEREVLLATLLVKLPDTVRHFTAYRDKSVPLEVIEEMRLAEGKSVEEWKGRGVEVGDAAWDVLLRAVL